MTLVQTPIETKIHGVSTVVHSYGFYVEKGRGKISPDKFHPADETGKSTKNLCNSFIGWVDNHPVIRSGSVDSKRKVHQFLALAHMVYHKANTKSEDTLPFRVSSNQINSIESEWDLIGLQHQYLVESGKELSKGAAIIHSCTTLENFYATHPPTSRLISDLKALHELPKLLNMEAWAAYCSWFNDFLQVTFSELKYDAVDEYTLEGYIVDFEHEVVNPYLETTKKRLLELELSIGTKESADDISYNEVVKLEKELIVTRENLKDIIRSKYEILVEINRTIKIIEQAHPELISLKLVGELLEGLLAYEVDGPDVEIPPFVNQQVLHQLLNDEMGVISAVNCKHGVDRTNIAFAIRLATLQLKKLASKEDVIELAINWVETTQKVHHCVSTRGVDRLEDWISHIADHHFQSRVKLLLQFWELFLENLNKFCKPITQLNTKDRVANFREGLYLNEEYISAFPPFIKVPHKGRPEKRMILEYDSKTDKPIGFTDEGHRLLLDNSFTFLN